jgi:chromosome segregation ATPase
MMTENELTDLETKLKAALEKWAANDTKIKESASRCTPYVPGKTGELIRLKGQQEELEQEIEVLKIRISLLKPVNSLS